MNKTILTLLVTSLVGAQAYAGSVTLPNTFVDGTTASASEVNANFNATKSAVDDNDSRTTTNTTNITANTNAISAAIPQIALKDANGVYIGRVLGMSHISGPYVLTDLGYRTLIYLARGRVEGYESSDIFYESTDCLGAAYVGPGLKSKGTVFTPAVFSEVAYNMGFIFYSTHDAQEVTVDINSQLETSDINNITCNTTPYPSPVSMTLYPAYPNDPSVTGIQNTAYPTRMRIE